MAENKNSFLLYADLIHTVEELEDNEAGMLFKTILRYVNDENPEVVDKLVKIAFEPIKRQLKRDLKKYETAKVDKSNNGKLGNLKRWNVDLYDKVLKKEMTIEEAESIAICRKTSLPDSHLSPPIANVAVTVNDTVSDTDTVTDINTQLSSEDQFFEVLRQKTPKSFSDALLRLKAKELHNRYKYKNISSLGGLISKVISDMKPDCKVKFYNPGAASYGYKTIDEWERIKHNTALQFECYEAV